MADRFFASYEDEFSTRPIAGRDRSSVLPNAGGRYYGAPPSQSASHWPEPDWHDADVRADPADQSAYSAYDDVPPAQAYAAQPMFAPLDRRGAKPAVSLAPPNVNPSFAGRPSGGPAQDDLYAYDPPRGATSNYPAYGAREPGFLQSDRLVKLTQWAGTLCSVLVLLGAVYWAYELAVRDARGIPVVRAAEGPLRVAPATPGGEVSANQGLAVNAIAAKGGSEPMPDVVTLAPAPLQLAQEDVASTASAEAPAAVSDAAMSDVAVLEPNLSAPPVTAEVVPNKTGSDLADLAAKTPDVMPISDEAAVEAALAMALSDGNEPVTKSNTDTAQIASPESADTGVTAPPTSEVDPASIPAGTKLVQLGAFDDDASARAAWAVLQTQFTDLIGTKSLVVQQAKSGGRVFYRLRAHGFADEDETRRFCAALLAENASCIPVSQR